ncbi:hypothetical protein MNY66_16450 (plasmid) [Moellerella wisconsensis]|uniref:Uncharacterized protein n=1 Tax=Moellerella wisconsensis TaxID=158849 RepID=A0ACD3YBV8_9GAMM|nr:MULTISPECIES: hypothetical protein [Morganellaceae]QCJ72215.1 hypothetical protein C9446_20660 [Providencia heimbachae]UNH40633.1 hypothetical protein MNY70_17500 [Moellerella wisconsensis]UNH44337.1 hypothetical protein MNY66_16450 [Moellerella wisconsensis]
MGRAVQVKFGRQEYPSKKAAIRHFMVHRESVKEWGTISEGTLFDDLKELYLSYCEADESWEYDGREITEFSVDHEPRQNGDTWASHLCYWVHFSITDKIPFSFRLAVENIVKSSSKEAGYLMN